MAVPASTEDLAIRGAKKGMLRRSCCPIVILNLIQTMKADHQI